MTETEIPWKIHNLQRVSIEDIVLTIVVDTVGIGVQANRNKGKYITPLCRKPEDALLKVALHAMGYDNGLATALILAAPGCAHSDKL